MEKGLRTSFLFARKLVGVGGAVAAGAGAGAGAADTVTRGADSATA